MEQVGTFGRFYNCSASHDGNPIRNIRDDTKIVTDENYAHSFPCPNFIYKIENLSLDRCIKRGCRLVSDEEFRAGHQGKSDHYSLTQPTGKLMGVLRQTARGIPNSDRFKHFRNLPPRVFGPLHPVLAQNFIEMGSDRPYRVQAVPGVLKHGAYFFPAQVTQ